MMRICDEAVEQGGLLTQEDLATLLMCDVKTIGRDVQSLKKREIILPTRGQQKDIGPGLTHRSLIARKWLEGHEETAIYSYDSNGRLETVTKGIFTYTYSYLNESPYTVETITMKKNDIPQIHSKREFDKLMRTTKFSWINGGAQ